MKSINKYQMSGDIFVVNNLLQDEEINNNL